MTKLRLSMALADNSRTAPLVSGAVGIEGVDLDISTIHPSELFWRQLKFGEFDISEMSLATLLVLNSAAKETGEKLDWVAIPVFTSRKFFHTGGLARVDSGIDGPADLAGKNVGVPEYQQTAAVWTRGVFADDFGVKPSDINWFMERVPEVSHAGSTGFTPPEGVTLNRIDLSESIGSKMLDGTLDATIMYLNSPNLVDRSRSNLSNNPEIKTLFPDVAAEQARYYAKWGMFPVNHCVVVRRSLAEAYPWLVLNTYQALVTARDVSRKELVTHLSDYIAAGVVTGDSKKGLAKDLYAYGVADNRRELDTVCRYAHEQGLTSSLITVEDLFDERTLGM